MNMQKCLNILIVILICLTFFSEIPVRAETFNLDIQSPSTILIDGNTGQVLYKKNEQAKEYPASITKLMTALLALEKLDPTDSITFSKNAVLNIEFGSSHIGIQEGEVLTVDQALHGLLLMSANEVANGLAEKTSGSIEAFTGEMNKRAEALGATHSHFVNPHGLHDEDHYTTAYDMALIAKELVKTEGYLDIMKDITYQIPLTNKSTEIRYLSQQHKMMNEKRDATLYRPDVIGGKTGYTNEAGHTLVTIAQEGEQILIAVVLNAKSENLYKDTNALLDYGFTLLKKVTINQNEFVDTLPIMKGNKNIGNATVTLKEPVEVAVLKSHDPASIKYKMNISQLKENVSKGDIVGTVSIYDDDQFLLDTDMVIDKVSIVYNITQTTSHLFPWLMIFFITIIILILILLFLKRARCKRKSLSKKSNIKPKTNVSSSKQHYSRYKEIKKSNTDYEPRYRKKKD